MRCVTTGERDTERLGNGLGRTLRAGDIVAFTGDLGAGKTVFTRGIARGVGYTGRVTSPTFSIVQEYLGGRLPLFHFDLYRLTGPDDLRDIGWDDYLERGGVCVLEWSEVAGDLLEESCIHVDIRLGETEQTRVITISGVRE